MQSLVEKVDVDAMVEMGGIRKQELAYSIGGDVTG